MAVNDFNRTVSMGDFNMDEFNNITRFKDKSESVRLKIKGWWEEYHCGCVSKTERYKKDLLGYCPAHGEDRRAIFPDTQAPPTQPHRLNKPG